MDEDLKVPGRLSQDEEGATTRKPAIAQRGDIGSVPLSFAQQRSWFLDRLNPGNPAYTVSEVCRLRGALNAAALEQGLNEVVRRHEALRTTFATVDGQPVQVIVPTMMVPLPVVDLQPLPQTQREAEALHLARREAQLTFELASGPLLPASLIRLDAEEYVLLVVMHHIVTDGWSMDLFWQELATLYGAFVGGYPSPLPELPIQYADFAIWQRRWLTGDVLDDQLGYWKRQLAHAPMLELPTDRSRPAVQSYGGARQSLSLPQPLAEGLRMLSRQHGCTLFMTSCAMFRPIILNLEATWPMQSFNWKATIEKPTFPLTGSPL